MIGQPLDVRVQLLLAPGEEAASQCVVSDVFYGDTQVSPGAVRSAPGTAGTEAVVRVQSTLPVNEPIVTLYVRAGCSNVFTRRYVLLAEPSPESASAAAPVPSSAPAAAVLPPAASPVAPPAAAAPRVQAAPPVRSGSGAPPRAPRAARADTAPPVPSVVRRTPPSAAARLQLDPVDLGLDIERDPTLRLSPLMLSEPGVSEEARAAAAQRWKAVNASPEDILRDARKLAELEARMVELQSTQTGSEASLLELKTQLAQARDQRYLNPLVYLLGALLLLTLLVLLVVWRRKEPVPSSAASRAWWSQNSDDRTAALDHLEPPARRATAVKASPAPRAAVDEGIDFNLDDDSTFDRLTPKKTAPARGVQATVAAPVVEPPPLHARDKRDFSASAIGLSRSIAAEELFDVQQQADFFVSLGEDGQAIEVLRNHLAESLEPSPMAYLDLFKLYHRLGRRQEYDQLRDEFNQVFNAGAPPFDHYNDAGRGLEAYETAFTRIQSLWPQPRVLDLIEQSLFRDVDDDEVEVFDLEAYRELLLLHAIAKDLIKRDGAPPAEAQRHSEFRHTSAQPLKATSRVFDEDAPAAHGKKVGQGDWGDRNTEPMGLDDPAMPAPSRFELDVNLDDLSEFSAFEASLPEVETRVEPTAGRQPQGGRPGGNEGNLIDFEVLDITPPQQDGHPDLPPGKQA